MKASPEPQKNRKHSALILTNDRNTPASKTSRYLSLALRRLGTRTFVRDTSDLRSLFSILETEKLEKHIGAAETIHHDRFHSFVIMAGVDTVLSLDLHWLFHPEPFLEHENINHIASIWFDDLRTACTTAEALPHSAHTSLSTKQAIQHPKVHHFFYGKAQIHEAELLGFPAKNTHHSKLAAPSEFLKLDHPCIHPDRIAFIGNPGIPTPPTPQALHLMEQKASLTALRKVAAQEASSDPTITKWKTLHPDIPKLITSAIEEKITSPHTSALHLLHQTASHFPHAFEKLNTSGHILDAALLIKLVTRYDRPALIHRLYHHHILDVFSAPWEWEPYGIKAHPLVNFSRLPLVYQSYPAHLNGSNSARDATANEKLFEIAACARPSINLFSPDVQDCFSENEIILTHSLDEAEETTLELLKTPETFLEIGLNARERTAREHTWDHRLLHLLTTLSTSRKLTEPQPSES